MVRMRKSRLKKTIQYKVIENFVAGTTARCTASLVDINPKSAAYYFMRLRELIFLELSTETSHYFDGEIEVDESYFEGSRKGKCSQWAGKVPVFGLLKRGVVRFTSNLSGTAPKNIKVFPFPRQKS